MFNYLQKKGTVFAILVLGFFMNLSAQQPCDGQEEGLPDTQIPVTGISSANPEAYCIYFRFDSDVTGMPIGITMDLWHEYEGDLGIFVEACGQILNVLQRPGAEGNCDAGCSGMFSNCGSSDQVGTPEEPEIINFYDFGPEPDNGIASGGTFGLTLDDSCMVSTLTVNSFTELWSNCSPGLVEAEICFTDHAFQHAGYVSNLNFIFPNPYVCGCMDPDAINYNPDASVSSGGCIYDCPDFGLEVPITAFDLCSGGDTITISASADLAESPDFEWIETGGTDFLKDNNEAETDLCIPADYVGQLIYNLTVTDAYGCQEFETVVVNVAQGPDLQLLGATSVCETDSTWLYITGGPFETINWSTGATGDSIWVGAGMYTVTVTDDQSTCSRSASASVMEIFSPNPIISGPDTICYAASTTLFADTIYSSYLWSTGVDTTFIQVDSATTYSLTVTDENGCVGVGDFTLETFDSLTLAIAGPDRFCAGDSVTLNATADYDSYLWSTGDTTVSILAYQAGSYIVTALDTNACSITDTFILSENPLPSPVILGPAVLCSDSTAMLSLSENYTAYIWSTGDTTHSITTTVLGTYEVTVTDTLGCNGIASYELMPPAPIAVNIVGDTLFCLGDTTTLNATTGFVSYNWSDGTNLNPLRTDQTGIFELTVTNSEGCGATASVELSNHPQQTPQINGEAEICAGATSTLSVASGFSDYQWSTGATSATIMVDSTATYSLEATDTNGCLAMASFDVFVRDTLLPEIIGDSLICANATGVLQAPTGFDTYTWTGGSTVDSLEISTPGSYSLTVTDDLNCTGTNEIEVLEVVLSPVIQGNSIFCFGGSTTLSVVDTFATYQWQGGPANNSFTVSTGGSYQLTVTDDLGCSANTSILVDTWDLPTPVIDGDLSFCVGGSSVLTAGAVYNFYQWNIAGETGQTLMVDQPGDYSLTVTDTNGCQGADTVSITTLPLPTPTIEGDLQFCPEGETILNTQSGYNTYSWSTGGQTEQITLNGVGPVGLTVTDSNNCEGSTSEETAHFSTQLPQINGDTQFCSGDTTTLTVSPAFSTYAWSNNESSSSIEIANTGIIGVTVTDANNCQTENSVALTHYAPPLVVITGPAGICEGENALLTVVDTFQTYLWEDGSMSNSLSVSTAGTYQVTVTTTNGCSATAQTSVVNWGVPTPEISGDFSFCEGGNTLLDGGGNYSSYQWNIAGETGQTLMVDQPGDYSLTVTDTNGCQRADTVSITTLPLPMPTIEGDLQFCPEGETTLNTQSGYNTYSWSTGGQTEQITLNGVGPVGLTVTDSNNCEGSTSEETAHFSTQLPQINGDTQFCSGDTTTLTVSPAFSTYAWSNNESSSSIEIANTGIVSVTVTDANNCQTENSVELTHYAPPLLVITGPAGICEGGNALLTVVDTFQTYLWEDGSMSNSLSVSTAGTYQVTVTTTNGCSATAQTSLVNWDVPTPEISGDFSFCEGGNTLLDGGGNYSSYQWSIVGENQQTLAADQAGDYMLTVTDTNGCQGADTVNLTVLPLPIPVIEGDLTFCPGGNTILNSQDEYMAYNWSNGEQTMMVTIDQAEAVGLTVTDNNNCVGSATVNTTLFATMEPDILGETRFCQGEQTELIASPGFATYSWSNGDDQSIITTSEIGLVGVTVTDSNNCQTSNSITLDYYQPAALNIDGLDGFCIGGTTSLSVVDTFANYVWSNGEQNASLEVATAGSYSLIATDNNGCLAYDTFTVETYNLPLPEISGILSFCTANSTTLGVMGGEFVSYNWSTGSNASTIQVSTEGLVGVTITDTNGCMNTTEEFIAEVSELSPQLVAASGICPGETTVIYTANNYESYLWSDGSSADSLLVNTAGEYQLTVTNSQGCTGTSEVTIVAFTTPSLTMEGIDYFCTGQTTTLTAMSEATVYEWSTGEETASIEIAEAGDYFVTATNTEGCSATLQETIFEQTLPDFTLVGDAIFCEDSTTTLQVLPAYAMYSWSTGESTQSISVGSPGMVEVVVTDSLGCSDTSEMELSDVPNPIAVTGPDQDINCAITEVQLESASEGTNLSYQWSGPGINVFNQEELSPWVEVEGPYSLIVVDTLYGCVSSPANLEVIDLRYTPYVELSVLNELDCNSTTVLVNGTNSDSGPQFVYQWYDEEDELIEGANSLTYQASVAQEYTLIITDTLSSCWASDSIVVEIDDNYPFVDAGLTQQLDCGQAVGTLTGMVNPDEDFISIQWTGPAGSNINPVDELTVSVDQAGWYFLQATDLNNGCTNLDSVLVTEDFIAPTALTSGDVVLFCNDENTLLSGLGSSAGSDFQYQWLFNGEPLTNAANLQFLATDPGLYTLQVTDVSNNCTASASLDLSIDPSAPQAIEVQYVSPTCAGDNNGSIQITSVSGGMTPYTYSLSGGPFLMNTYFNGLGAGSYDLVLEDANGCQLNTNLVLEDGNDLSLDLGEDQVLEWGEEADIYPFVSVDSSALSLLTWQTVATLECPDCLYQTDLLLDESTRFFLSIIDSNGCVAEDDVTIYIEKTRNIFVPNVFSPNGDGRNDRFFIFTDQKSVKEVREMKIFDRWGEYIFENYNFQPNNPYEGWDGRWRGTVLNPGVFVWYALIELVNGEVIELKGDVTLVK